MKLEHFLQEWAASPHTEAPVLLHSSDPDRLQEELQRLIAVALCTQVSSQAIACASCQMCRLVQRQAHPDIVQLNATLPQERSMKAVRSFLQIMARTPFHGRRVATIAHIDRLSLPALHALLKPLEEPAATTRYILTTLYPSKLPATILSRCQLLTLPNAVLTTSSADPFDQLSLTLADYLGQHGPSPALRRAFWRLRDYYQIRQNQGNTKLARQVVVACLYQLHHTLGHTHDTQ